MSCYILSIKERIRACWKILTNKEFYMEVITSRYHDGSPLVTEVISNVPYTETAINKLIKSLKSNLAMLKEEKKYRSKHPEKL